MMTQTSHAPETFVQTALGWSDLEEDEALLLWLFRHWQHGRWEYPHIEIELTEHLAEDRYALVLTGLFALFAQLDEHLATAPPEWPLLSTDEIELLNALSDRPEPAHHHFLHQAVVSSCRNAFAAAGIRIRHCSTIDPSGHDEMTLRIDRACLQATR